MESITRFLHIAIVAAFFTWFATKTAIHFGLNLQVASGVPEFCDSVALKAYPLTAALLVGTLGALQCAISRQH